MQETRVLIPGWEDPLEEEIATHSSIPAWEISWTEEPGGLQSMGSQSQTGPSADYSHSVAHRLLEGKPWLGTDALGGHTACPAETGPQLWLPGADPHRASWHMSPAPGPWCWFCSRRGAAASSPPRKGSMSSHCPVQASNSMMGGGCLTGRV